MKKKLYYLDDEEMLCKLFKEIFDTDQVEVSTFSKPDDFIEAVKLERPDLCFIDFRLPGENGEKVASKLDPQIPKFLVTGDIDYPGSDQFLKVFKKPIEIPIIREEIKKYLEK